MMYLNFLGRIFLTALFSVFFTFTYISSSNIPGLPFCPNKNSSSVLLVSTLDGKLSVVNSTGSLLWAIPTGPGPLLTSNIHNQELTNNGEWIRIIPSLSGNLYQFDGSSIDPLTISAEILLKSSLKYSENLVIAGGIEVRTYGVGFRSGKVLYECTQSNCTNAEGDEVDDILFVERNTQTVRAFEPRSGTERWNFSVGLHDVKLPQVSCIDTKPFHWNISAVIPEGLLISGSENVWQYKFASPIVRVWAWNGAELSEINLFAPKNILPLVTIPKNNVPSIYLGMHNLQLYVHESQDMLDHLKHKHPELAGSRRHTLPKIPWKPVAANFEISEEDSTALSVLNNSGYINGNGYYLYSENIENEATLYAENESVASEAPRITFKEKITFIHSCRRYYKELLLLLLTAILSPILFKIWNNSNPNLEKIIIIEKPVKANITQTSDTKAIAEPNNTFTSRYTEDFQTIQCLGKGGFGVVFEVKQKIDECHYAIKRITLPNESKSRSRVMREVRALAKLEHKNIVRYFCSWLEHPPIGWDKNHDKQWLGASLMEPLSEESSNQSSIAKPRQKSYSVSIQMPTKCLDDESVDSCISYESESQDDSFIVFANSNEGNSKELEKHSKDSANDKNFDEIAEKEITKDNEVSDYHTKKINWKRPGRKHHSWDASQNNLIELKPSNPPVFLYIQMQLCQKESLKEWLSVNKDRDYIYILNLFSQILDAVEYVHISGLIHRDLKPGNIFFSLEGQIKVGDFGLVKDMEGPLEYEHYSSHSRKGHTREVGTHLYMSPEQFRGSSYDYKVDIFALGVILFELIVPFSTHMERIEALTNVKKQIYPEGFSKKYPDEYTLLQNMLNVNPNKRLTTLGIRSRKPFKKEDEISDNKYDYNLNGLMNKT